MYPECLKKNYFVGLMLHRIHRSYPSRKRTRLRGHTLHNPCINSRELGHEHHVEISLKVYTEVIFRCPPNMIRFTKASNLTKFPSSL